MIFTPTELPGAFVIDPERIEDQRGFFARTFCEDSFRAHGLSPVVAQCNVSYNHRAGTVRGMHYQAAPHEEAKLVRCTRGAVYDVIVDLRRDSLTYRRWIGVELSESNHRMLYIPEGFAHGFQTLADGSEVLYQMSTAYVPGSAGGVRWDDPAIRVRWPREVTVISARDQGYPDLAC